MEVEERKGRKMTTNDKLSQNCKNCWCYVPFEGGRKTPAGHTGECHYNPPHWAQGEEFRWPPVYEAEWCYQWEPADEWVEKWGVQGEAELPDPPRMDVDGWKVGEDLD